MHTGTDGSSGERHDPLSLHQAYLRVFEGPEGQKVLGDLFRRCGLFESSLRPTALDMAAAEGRRGVALYLRRMLDPAVFERLAQERAQGGPE